MDEVLLASHNDHNRQEGKNQQVTESSICYKNRNKHRLLFAIPRLTADSPVGRLSTLFI